MDYTWVLGSIHHWKSSSRNLTLSGSILWASKLQDAVASDGLLIALLNPEQALDPYSNAVQRRLVALAGHSSEGSFKTMPHVNSLSLWATSLAPCNKWECWYPPSSPPLAYLAHRKVRRNRETSKTDSGKIHVSPRECYIIGNHSNLPN